MKKTNRWPLLGSSPSTSFTSAYSPSACLRMSVGVFATKMRTDSGNLSMPHPPGALALPG